MSSFIALRKTLDLSSDSNHHLLVGRQTRDIPDTSSGQKVVTAIKRHYDFTVDVSFDSAGGSECESQTYTLGSTYKDLPTPTKSQNIFLGWIASDGQYVLSSDVVELSNTLLTAQWETVNITGDYTSYLAVTTSSYKNTGIYAAARYSSASAVYVDWGDGAVAKVNGSISQLAHTYSAAGSYNVKVSNNITSFAPSYNNSTWYGTTSQNRYTFKTVTKTGSRVTSMPTYAFYYCAALSSVDFLSSCYTSLTALPSYAFTYCTSIKQLSALPTRIKSLGSQCFQNCTSLSGIQDLRSTGLTSLVNSYVFSGCSSVKEWKLPSSFGTYFGSYAFQNNTTLSAIELPSTLTSVNSYCFNGDTQLKHITIPSKVTILGDRAFYNCYSLSSVEYQTTALTAIGSYTFYGCYRLRDINLPQTVKSIGQYAFQNCYSSYASALTLPSSLTSLGTYAFTNCNQLKSIEIPSALATLNNYVFNGCYKVSSIVDYRLTAQTAYAYTFGQAASIGSTGYTGYSSRGSNVLCTYVIADGYEDGYWADPLQDASKCGFSIQYIDPENLKYCQVTFDAGDGTLDETTKQCIQDKKIGTLPTPIAPEATPYFGGWWTGEGGTGTKCTSSTKAPAQETLTLYALYGTTPFQSYTVDLNSQWRESTSQANPDSTAYDGVYESNSNYNVNNGYAKMYVRISGYDTFKLYIRSYAESSFDYTIAFNADVDVTRNPSSGTTGVKAHTSGNQKSGTAISNYTLVTYTGLDGGDHFICIVYRKDGSAHSGNDRGYLLIPKEQS